MKQYPLEEITDILPPVRWNKGVLEQQVLVTVRDTFLDRQISQHEEWRPVPQADEVAHLLDGERL